MKKYVLLISIVAFILYIVNLKPSLGFFDDTARDTIRALEMLKHRELTLIGPPMSIGLFGIREVYFGSLALYIAAIGLWIGKLDVTGAIYPTIFFFTISIYFFHQLVRYLTDSKKTQVVSTIIYALSPVTVTFARFFWNPNLILPFSVFFWLLIIRKYSSEKWKLLGYLLAGCIGGIMMNFHYVGLVPPAFCIFLFLFKRKIQYAVSIFFGLLVGCIPLILFELKHKFYLTNALLYNLSHKGTSDFTGDKVMYFYSSFLTVLGLKPSEISHPIFAFITPIIHYGAIVILLYLMLQPFPSIPHGKKVFLIPVLILNLTAVLMSAGIYNVHYIFPIYPLFIWYVGLMISQIKTPIVIYLIMLVMIGSSLLIPYDVHSIKKDYLSVTEIEAVANYIVHDNPTPPYNITENITGSTSHSISLRLRARREGATE